MEQDKENVCLCGIEKCRYCQEQEQEQGNLLEEIQELLRKIEAELTPKEHDFKEIKGEE